MFKSNFSFLNNFFTKSIIGCIAAINISGCAGTSVMGVVVPTMRGNYYYCIDTTDFTVPKNIINVKPHFSDERTSLDGSKVSTNFGECNYLKYPEFYKFTWTDANTGKTYEEKADLRPGLKGLNFVNKKISPYITADNKLYVYLVDSYSDEKRPQNWPVKHINATEEYAISNKKLWQIYPVPSVQP